MAKDSGKFNRKFRDQEDYERAMERREYRETQKRRKENFKNQRATKNSQNTFFDLNDLDY